MAAVEKCDVAIVGAGLAGGLIALALRKKRPDIDVRLIDGAGVIGGNHVWSFFASDVADTDRWIIAPLISYGWKSYDIAFPAHARTLNNGYYSIESERMDTLVRAALPDGALMLRRKVAGASPTAVVFDNGDRLEAGGVIDARGPGDLSLLDVGWQKFLGREFRLSEPHDDPRPMVMDATVPQIDGYRFVYCLPFSATRMFVEDTYYSDTPDLDRAVVADRVHDYVAKRGWKVEQGPRNKVLAVELWFRPKDQTGRTAAARELDETRDGRKARREGQAAPGRLQLDLVDAMAALKNGGPAAVAK